MSTQPASPTIPKLGLYGLLALPVAVASLPIYIHIPQFYAEVIGLELAVIGLVLLAVRLFDTVQDPFLGLISDRLVERGYSRKTLIAFGMPVLLAGLLMLVNPPMASMAWFIGSLLLLYTAFSFVSINYYAYGAEWSEDYDTQSVISTWREAFILIGILLASVLPQVLINEFNAKQGYSYFGYLIAALVVLVAPVALRFLPASQSKPSADYTPLWQRFKAILASRPYVWLLMIFFLNGLANSIPATLVLFYVGDVLQLEEQAGYFLGVYFLAGLLGMPLWLKLAQYAGKKRCLMLSMVIASGTFVWAFTLGAGDATAFYVVCILSGACLGADMAMPPAMLGDVIHEEKSDAPAGYFGIWNLVWKLTFAVAAGLVFPILALMGYEPSQEVNSEHALCMLAMMYALLPSAIKLVTAVLLYLSPLERPRSQMQLA